MPVTKRKPASIGKGQQTLLTAFQRRSSDQADAQLQTQPAERPSSNSNSSVSTATAQALPEPLNVPALQQQQQQEQEKVSDVTDGCLRGVAQQSAGTAQQSWEPSRQADSPAAVKTADSQAGRSAATAVKAPAYTHYLVLDFEATTNAAVDLIPMEIIEFSCCILEADSLTILADFQEYCRPTENPILTAFCTQLTGITQDRVNSGIPLGDAMARLDTWLHEGGFLASGCRLLPVTWSEWDLKIQLESECKWRQITIPSYLRRWHDLRPTCKRMHISRANGLRGTVEAAGLQWQGRLHSGIDDARNTAALAAHLIRKGAVLAVTGSFGGVPGVQRQSTLFPGRAAKKAKTVDKFGKWNGQCECGARARLCVVKRPGSNMGRQFYGCGTWTILKGTGDCKFHKWSDEV